MCDTVFVCVFFLKKLSYGLIRGLALASSILFVACCPRICKQSPCLIDRLFFCLLFFPALIQT